jgi:outer membrane protein assembly factor BamB/tetratricopeptide (TPR) repeat protein
MILALPAAICAQRVRVQAPIGGAIETQGRSGDDGQPVEMFESPNLDRFLRRAREFLEQEKYQEAIQVLQSVIEGRTLEAIAPADPDAPAPPAEQPPVPAPGPPPARPAGGDQARLADPAQTVFSHDGRIYRPARRLCHEYLSGMPAIGISLYRTMYEATAAEALQQALHSGNASDLELVGNRWFVTEAAGRALQILAERHMHEGRYRAAVQVLRDLSELYPAANMRALGISPLWCQFKIALCIRLAGEAAAAREAARQLAAEHPNESLRIMGELQPVSGLHESALFADGDASLVTELDPARPQDSTWVAHATADLVPLWQYRFRGRHDPYRPMSAKQGQEGRFVFVGEGMVSNAMPPANKYGTGTQVLFTGRGGPRPQVLFLEHYRLRMAQAFTGVLTREGDGSDEPPQVQDNQPRARVPVYDFALMRPVDDGQRWLVVVGYARASQSIDALKTNEVVAYDQQTGARQWSTADFREGDDGFQDVTFLASPVVFGERLLAPVLRRGAYSLQCFDRATGRPLWCTRIHSGGSGFYKAPGSPVLVMGNLAYVVTNAGALAAIDAFAGDLRWIRRYERRDPLRQQALTRKPTRGQAQFMPGVQYVEQDLPGYLPNELLAVEGLVITAPCDGEMLLAVDGASGEPVWMLDGSSRYAPYGRLQYLVGANDRHLFAASETDLVCIELRTGVLQWHLPLPVTGAAERWRGRGCVIGDVVVLPGDREVLVASADRKSWQRLRLPAFGIGDEPLAGPCNLYSSGPWLAVCYSRGIEMYTTAAALLALAADAADPIRKAEYLVQAGRGTEALEGLIAWLGGTVADAELRRVGAERLVALARAEAITAGSSGLAILDRVRPLVQERQARLLWHLARLDLCKHVQDLRTYEVEQQQLYRFMEGKD